MTLAEKMLEHPFANGWILSPPEDDLGAYTFTYNYGNANLQGVCALFTPDALYLNDDNEDGEQQDSRLARIAPGDEILIDGGEVTFTVTAAQDNGTHWQYTGSFSGTIPSNGSRVLVTVSRPYPGRPYQSPEEQGTYSGSNWVRIAVQVLLPRHPDSVVGHAKLGESVWSEDVWCDVKHYLQGFEITGPTSEWGDHPVGGVATITLRSPDNVFTNWGPLGQPGSGHRFVKGCPIRIVAHGTWAGDPWYPLFSGEIETAEPRTAGIGRVGQVVITATPTGARLANVDLASIPASRIKTPKITDIIHDVLDAADWPYGTVIEAPPHTPPEFGELALAGTAYDILRRIGDAVGYTAGVDRYGRFEFRRRRPSLTPSFDSVRPLWEWRLGSVDIALPFDNDITENLGSMNWPVTTGNLSGTGLDGMGALAAPITGIGGDMDTYSWAWFSVAMMVHLPDPVPDVALFSAGGSSNGQALWIEGQRLRAVSLWNGSNQGEASARITPGWHAVCVLFDGTGGYTRLYIDGVLVGDVYRTNGDGIFKGTDDPEIGSCNVPPADTVQDISAAGVVISMFIWDTDGDRADGAGSFSAEGGDYYQGLADLGESKQAVPGLVAFDETSGIEADTVNPLEAGDAVVNEMIIRDVWSPQFAINGPATVNPEAQASRLSSGSSLSRGLTTEGSVAVTADLGGSSVTRSARDEESVVRNGLMRREFVWPMPYQDGEHVATEMATEMVAYRKGPLYRIDGFMFLPGRLAWLIQVAEGRPASMGHAGATFTGHISQVSFSAVPAGGNLRVSTRMSLHAHELTRETYAP